MRSIQMSKVPKIVGCRESKEEVELYLWLDLDDGMNALDGERIGNGPDSES